MTRALNGRMGKAPCARSWEIEAARDGRLSGDARESLGRHVEHCLVCREQSEYVEGLGRTLRELDAPEVDDVAVRRLRQDVLARVDAELAGRSLPPPRLKRSRFVIPAFAFAAIVVFAFIALRWNHVPAVVALPKTTVDAVDEGGARWTQRTEGEIERVELNDGTLRLRVQKTPGGKRVIVRVPDGEIEDLGTVFHVVVSHGRTQRVGVDEGRVTIRLMNAMPITISSGQTWERPVEPAAILTALPTFPMPVATPASLPSASNRSNARAPLPRPDVSMRIPALPPNAAKEDAAYLRAIQLRREGRESEARTAAKEYLRRFPDGFRREEMGRIAE